MSVCKSQNAYTAYDPAQDQQNQSPLGVVNGPMMIISATTRRSHFAGYYRLYRNDINSHFRRDCGVDLFVCHRKQLKYNTNHSFKETSSNFCNHGSFFDTLLLGLQSHKDDNAPLSVKSQFVLSM